VGRPVIRSQGSLGDSAVMTRTLSQLRSFVIIGIASTLAYVTLYNAARGVTTPSIANVLALAITTIANTAANRHIT
jgi:putative flippase GtrA